jgi:hypothetical protein
MTRSARSAANQPSFLEIGEGVIFGIDCLVVGGTVAPGLLFCVPAILFAITPLIVIGVLLVLVALVMALAASPVVLGVLAVRALRRRRRREAIEPVAEPTPLRAPAPAPVAMATRADRRELSHA